MNPVLFAFPLGTDQLFNLQMTTDGTTPLTGVYEGTDTLTAKVWAGGDQPLLFSPVAAWIAAANSQFSVGFTAAQTASLSVGTYYLQVLAGRGGQTVPLLDDVGFELRPSPGSGGALKSYCSVGAMLELAPWIERIQGIYDYAAFARPRNHAALWFEDVIQRHWRGGQSVAPDYYFLPGLSFSGFGFNRFLTVYRSGVRSATLQDWLDTGGPSSGPGLMQTQQVIECCACYAIAQVAAEQVYPGNNNEEWYARKRSQFLGRAETLATLITAEIDSDNDGLTDIYVRLGVHDTLEG